MGIDETTDKQVKHGFKRKTDRTDAEDAGSLASEQTRRYQAARVITVFCGARSGSGRPAGPAGQPRARVMRSKTSRPVPSASRHWSARQRRNTPPSSVSKEKKFGRRN